MIPVGDSWTSPSPLSCNRKIYVKWDIIVPCLLGVAHTAISKYSTQRLHFVRNFERHF